MLQNSNVNRFGSAFTSAGFTGTSSTAKSSSNTSNMSDETIIGISVGTLVCIIAAIIGVVFFMKYKSVKQNLTEDDALQIVQVKSTSTAKTETPGEN